MHFLVCVCVLRIISIGTCSWCRGASGLCSIRSAERFSPVQILNWCVYKECVSGSGVVVRLLYENSQREGWLWRSIPLRDAVVGDFCETPTTDQRTRYIISVYLFFLLSSMKSAHLNVMNFRDIRSSWLCSFHSNETVKLIQNNDSVLQFK